MLPNLVSLLLIFLKPAEVYCVIDKLVLSSKEKIKNGQEDGLRWHVTLSQEAYNKSITCYIDSYLYITWRKKRSVIVHCRDIGFDYTQFVDSCFRHFLTDYLSLGNLLNFMMVYLVEGQKAMYRFTYAITKAHKEKLKSLNNPKTFM